MIVYFVIVGAGERSVYTGMILVYFVCRSTFSRSFLAENVNIIQQTFVQVHQVLLLQMISVICPNEHFLSKHI